MSQITFDFSGCNFIVAGASSGMGRETVCQLAYSGATVLALARRENKLAELVSAYPDYVVAAPVDVCNHDSIAEAISCFVEKYGKLSGSVYAAGINAFTPLRSFDMKQAKLIMDVSFWSGVSFLQQATKKKNSLEGASHILFSSAYSVYSVKGLFAYSAAKAAVSNAVRTLAKEIAPRQRVNAVMPGWVKSEMTDKMRDSTNLDEVLSNELLGEGSPEDVAGMILFLLSDRARWITGASFAVDGGFLA